MFFLYNFTIMYLLHHLRVFHHPYIPPIHSLFSLSIPQYADKGLWTDNILVIIRSFDIQKLH